MGRLGGNTMSTRGGLALCSALMLSGCGLADQLDPGTVSVRGVQPTLEQLAIARNSQLQDALVGRLETTAGYGPGALGPVDPRWSMVFEAGVYEIGRQCDQYLDGLFRFTADGLVQRGLAVLEVGPQGNTIVSPAPASFADLTY